MFRIIGFETGIPNFPIFFISDFELSTIMSEYNPETISVYTKFIKRFSKSGRIPIGNLYTMAVVPHFYTLSMYSSKFISEILQEFVSGQVGQRNW